LQLLNGDCLLLLPNIPDKSVDMILCDLPYGTTQNKWDSVISLDTLWSEYIRVLKDAGVVVLTASQPFTSTLVLSNPKMFKHEWIWLKNRGSNFANTVREPMKEHESVLVFSKGKWTYNKQMQERTGGGKNLIGAVQKDKGGKTNNYGNFVSKDITLSELRVPSSWQKFNCEVGLHPTQKPLPLFEYLIRTYTNEGDIVVDNCMGSGTTGVACKNLNRDFIGIELEPEYFQIATERIRAA
jgi:site-specific DNA-methyltransferase (adenine-specific)